MNNILRKVFKQTDEQHKNDILIANIRNNLKSQINKEENILSKADTSSYDIHESKNKSTTDKTLHDKWRGKQLSSVRTINLLEKEML